MTVAMSCPDRASLERLLERGAGPDEVERLAGHLETCVRCGDTVEALLAADPAAAALRGAKVEADTPSVQRLRARLAQLRPAAASQDTTTGENTPSAVPQPASLPLEATEDKSVSLAPPQRSDEIGRLGGYRILKELGRGGMGVVYQAEDLKLKRFVALKAMLPGLAADANARQRFLREAQAMAAVHHDHIVTIHAVDEDNGVPFLAMELLQGMPMDQWLKGGRKPSVAQVLRIGREIAEGLAAAHECGLIHRDVKPGNIWLDSSHQGRVKILDFGLARSGQEDVHLTRSGAIVGTPAYMAPEQARGETVDARGDLYSLGCVLYRLCTGAMPFAGNNATSLLMALALDYPKPVRDLNPDVPAALADLVTKLLAKDPARRPQTAREVIQALQAVASTSAASASSPTVSAVIAPPPPEPAAAPMLAKFAPGGGKRRTWILAAVTAGFLATAVAIVVIIRDKNGDKVAEVNVPPGGTVKIGDDGKQGDPAVAAKPTAEEAWLKQVASLPADKQVEAVVAELKARNRGFDGTVTPMIEYGEVTGLEFNTSNVTDIAPLRVLSGLKSLSCQGSEKKPGHLSDLSPLRDMKLTKLVCNHTEVSDLSPLKGMPLETLKCDWASISDLSPLKGMKLKELHVGGTQVSDLSPLKDIQLQSLDCSCTPVNDLAALKGMQLEYLECDWMSISDLSPLRGMPLKAVSCENTKVSDLSPLKGMKLTWLYCGNTKVSDLSPLKGMPLTHLNCDFKPDRDADILRSLKTLETINYKPAAEFWKDVGGAAQPPVDGAWLKQVAALPAEKQVEEVVAELKALNPGFDGKMTPTIENGEVTGLRFATNSVTDIAPLRALTGLETLVCEGSEEKWGRLSDLTPLKDMKLAILAFNYTVVSDLTPLKGMKLTELYCDYTQVSDLSPLRDMKLTILYCGGTKVSDLSPLKGMKLMKLWCGGAKVSDLSPLKDMKLAELACGESKVSDLSPLHDMKLTFLNFGSTPVSDLGPLKGMPLLTLFCSYTRVSDLTPLKGMPLQKLWCDFKPGRDAEILRSLKTLETINGKPAAEFWKDVDGAAQSPVDNAWLKQVAALQADKQVEAVAARLKELNPGFDGQVKPNIGNGVVTGLDFVTDEVTDLSPVRALPALKSLVCSGSSPDKGRLSDLSPLRGMALQTLICENVLASDLSPLKGMPLEYLDFAGTRVFDLSPLKGMPLTYLNCGVTPVFDLSPLKGVPLTSLSCNDTPVSELAPLQNMSLTELQCGGTRVSDLSPLKGMKLTFVNCFSTKVSDLSPLKDMPLRQLICCHGTPVSDLSPLKDMRLTRLECWGTKVSDLSPLRGMPLKEIWCDFKPERDAAILRSLKALEKINDKPAAEFWKEVAEKKPDPKP